MIKPTVNRDDKNHTNLRRFPQMLGKEELVN